jgi:hypothetical protein
MTPPKRMGGHTDKYKKRKHNESLRHKNEARGFWQLCCNSEGRKDDEE